MLWGGDAVWSETLFTHGHYCMFCHRIFLMAYAPCLSLINLSQMSLMTSLLYKPPFEHFASARPQAPPVITNCVPLQWHCAKVRKGILPYGYVRHAEGDCCNMGKKKWHKKRQGPKGSESHQSLFQLGGLVCVCLKPFGHSGLRTFSSSRNHTI